MNIFAFLGVPLGFILRLMYNLVQNYGWALILFTLITRLILLPLNIKQQKSLVQTQIIKPKMDALKKQCGNDNEKFSQESMKLYKKYGISPFSGCLPLLIQFPILFALFDVIKRPLKNIWGLPQDMCHTVIEAVKATMTELEISKIPAGYEELAATAKLCGAKAAELADYVKYSINYNFFGLDLSIKPTFDIHSPTFGIDWVWIIPIVAAITTYISSKLMNIGAQKDEKDEKDETKPKRPPRPGEKEQTDTASSMMTFMPIMTLVFSFMMPAGISVYWIAGNVFQVVQQYVINKCYVPKLKRKMEIEYNEREDNNKKRKNKR